MPTPLRQREPWRGHQHSQHETAHDLSDGHRLLPRLVPVDGDSGGTETREARDPRVCRSTLLETYGRRCGLTRCLAKGELWTNGIKKSSVGAAVVMERSNYTGFFAYPLSCHAGHEGGWAKNFSLGGS